MTNNHSMIILAGGFGSRLQSVSDGIPKALMPIGDLVYLDLLLKKMFERDIENVYLSLHYKPELFENYINNSIYNNMLSTIIESEPLGTGGAVNYVIGKSNISSPFFVINGDSLSDINLDQMLIEFDTRNLKAMIGLSNVEENARYGSVVVEQDGKVLTFEEKRVTSAGWINNGHYIFNKDVFDKFDGAFSLEKDLFPKLAHNQELGSFKVVDDNFIDMGIPEDYEKLCYMYKVSNQ